MNKLPVVSTIADAYRCAFGHLGAIIGLILVLTQLLYAVMYVAVTRQALGLRQGPAVIHFALGPPEFRMFGALLLIWMVSIGCALTFGLAWMAVIGLVAMGGGSVLSNLLATVLVLAGFGALIYIVLRFGFLLIPVTVIENRVDLIRGWTLAQRNFWRVLLVVVAVAGPIWAIKIGCAYALMGKDLAASLPPIGSGDQVIQQHAHMLEDVIRHHMPQLLGIWLILVPFEIGLTVSASAFGYRALAPEAVAEVRA